MDFRLNSPEGKQILATIRQGDYAHPGEQEAIAMVLAGLRPDRHCRVLDVGCGRGGTAAWIQGQGWSSVVGIDRDAAAIRYAQERYPEVSFRHCDVLELSEAETGRFDLICLFNSFYAFAEQDAALSQLHGISRPGAELRLFDYAQPTQAPLPAALGQEIGQPIQLDRIEAQLARAGWQQLQQINLSEQYISWYQDLLQKLAARHNPITAEHGEEWYSFFSHWYGALHQALINGQLQGILLKAVA